jgi:hypothetical protein
MTAAILVFDMHCVGLHRNSWEVADCTVMRKWKWLFVNGCKYKTLISILIEFLKVG